jgi:hypothetical protein
MAVNKGNLTTVLHLIARLARLRFHLFLIFHSLIPDVPMTIRMGLWIF